MKKMLIFMFISLITFGIANATPLELCGTNNSNCKLTWDNFSKGKVNDSNNHGDKVNCEPKSSISWDQAGKAVTIKYLGRTDKKSNTCYVNAGNIMGQNGKIISHGYLTADISFVADKSSAPNSDHYLWPAFWLVGNDPSGKTQWPISGEIDIAEHIFGGTFVHLIGTPAPNTFVVDPKYMPTEQWPTDAFKLGSGTNSYGMEWELDSKKVTLSFYYNNKKFVSVVATNGKSTVETNIFNAVSKNWLEATFDSDRQAISQDGKTPDPDSQRKHSITVSNLQVYNIAAPTESKQPTVNKQATAGNQAAVINPTTANNPTTENNTAAMNEQPTVSKQATEIKQ